MPPPILLLACLRDQGSPCSRSPLSPLALNAASCWKLADAAARAAIKPPATAAVAAAAPATFRNFEVQLLPLPSLPLILMLQMNEFVWMVGLIRKNIRVEFILRQHFLCYFSFEAKVLPLPFQCTRT